MAKAIMIQGTMSNAGKSVIAAGLCRIFKQDGYKVAPFKAQNMALNSFITKDGLEMGRAQVVQAEAAGVEPSVLMNPILLKPTNDTSSQVIVNGEVWQNLSAKEYYKNKAVLAPEVKKAYDKLAEDNDIIVIEGAGSPAEINLKDNDIVNMYMAKMVDAPVLLVGDIDRGGVFASLVGTMMLFDETERNLVKGFIINKFRGDVTILQPGLRQLEDIAKRPVLGVVPFLDVDIEDEDSLSSRIERSNKNALINIAVIRLPRISNFTDFMVFETFDGVNVKYVRHKDEILGTEDMIIIPGTKNTMADLMWMRQNGIEARITKFASKGGIVFGICGGYQMLGEELVDEYGVEEGGTLRGIGLLPCKTAFEKEKTRTRVIGKFNKVYGVLRNLSNMELEGYEIHMGKTEVLNSDNLTEIETVEGIKKSDGVNVENIYGSYVHGIFDKKGIANEIIASLMKNKGVEKIKIASMDMEEYKNQQYDKLAEGMRKAIDMKKIYEIMGL